MFHMGTRRVGIWMLRLLHLLMLLNGVHIFIANEYVSEVEIDGINLIQMEQHWWVLYHKNLPIFILACRIP